MIYKIEQTRKFEKAFRKILKSGIIKIDDENLKHVIESLENNSSLVYKFRDHHLVGNFEGYRECHIKPDLLLLYIKNEIELTITLLNIGTHAQIFN